MLLTVFLWEIRYPVYIIYINSKVTFVTSYQTTKLGIKPNTTPRLNLQMSSCRSRQERLSDKQVLKLLRNAQSDEELYDIMIHQ